MARNNNVSISANGEMFIKLDARNSVVIPATLRESLNLQHGDTLRLEVNNGALTLTPAKMEPVMSEKR